MRIEPFQSKPYFILLIFFSLLTDLSFSQPVVGLDNWFNNETESRTKKPFHYLWNDTLNSGYSQWGDIFKSKGAAIATIAKPTPASLERVNVYIIVDPDTTSESSYPNYISTADIKTITQWVKKGGVLAVLANDAPNCEFTNLNRLMKEFGMRFNHVTLHPVPAGDWEKGASVNLPQHPLFKGVAKIYMKEISDISVSGTATAVLNENGKVLMAENRFGKGYVFAVGDPWIYNEYIDHAYLPESFDNKKAVENLTGILLGHVRE